MTTTEHQPGNHSGSKVQGSLELFLEVHGIPLSTARNLALTIASIILVCLVAVFIMWRRTQAEKIDAEATRELFNNRAQTAANLETLMERCSSSKLAPLIMLKQAQAQYAEGNNYELALSTCDRFLKEYPGHELAAVAEFGRILCREARQTKEDLESSLKEFSEFATKHPGSFLAAEAAFGKARCMEQLGRFEEARQIYEDYKVSHPTENVWQERADSSLRIVEAALRRGKGAL
ncbi:MAG: tetratricopeptide repeat protein [bacterium]